MDEAFTIDTGNEDKAFGKKLTYFFLQSDLWILHVPHHHHQMFQTLNGKGRVCQYSKEQGESIRI